MEFNEAKDKAKDVMDKVVVTSKTALSKAGTAMQKWTDRSVIKVEIMQLRSRRKNVVVAIGKYVEQKFYREKVDSIESSDIELKKFIDELETIDIKIREKNKLLESIV